MTGPTTVALALLFSAQWIQLCTGETIEDYICTKKFRGCKVDYKERSCLEGEAVGCMNPFPYEDMQECHKDFYGQSNVCDQYKPCRNNGVCSPIITENHTRTYKCECVSTGYYGHRCEIKCPKDLSAKDLQTLPCLEI